MKIGIIGNGFVGKATTILGCKDVDILIYDIQAELCNPMGTTLADICQCDLIFVSVPTPIQKDGSYYMNIVETVINDIKSLTDLTKTIVVMRSTTPPGTCDRLNCYFMPEFLTEKNYMDDFKNNKDWIFGLKGTAQDSLFQERISQLMNYSYENEKISSNTIHFVRNKEAEMIKQFRNNYLATKVSFCNEIYEFCQLKEINYENVRKLAVADERIGPSHSHVPGPDGRRGFGGTCFPKDTSALRYEMDKSGMKSYIINAIIERNETVDRAEKDWLSNKGRCVI